MEQMEGIRDQQESLARLHFELSEKQDIPTAMSEDGETIFGLSKINMHYLCLFISILIIYRNMKFVIKIFLALRIANENMDRLMTRLQLLSLSIGKLNPSVEDQSQGSDFTSPK